MIARNFLHNRYPFQKHINSYRVIHDFGYYSKTRRKKQSGKHKKGRAKARPFVSMHAFLQLVSDHQFST